MALIIMEHLYKSPYILIKQNIITNSLFRIGAFNLNSNTAPRGTTCTKLRGNITINRDCLTVVISDYEQLNSGLRTSTFKLFDALVLWFTNHDNDPDVLLPIKDYMSLCSVSDMRYTRSKVLEDLQVLNAISISYNSKNSKKKNSKNYIGIKIMSEQTVRNGIIRIHFTETFSEMLKTAPVMPYPLKIFSIRSDKFPNAFYILRRIIEHKNMNFGKANENTISVKTLLNACPIIPLINTVRQSSNPTPYNRIILPFLRDLQEACYRIGIQSCDYRLVYRGKELSENEIKELSYEDFYSDINLHFLGTWIDYPSRKKTHYKKLQKGSVIS